MKHAAFIAKALATPWAMQREVLSAYAGVLARKAGGLVVHEGGDIVAAEPVNAASPGRSNVNRTGSIAVVPLMGTVIQRAGMMELCGGGTSVQRFMAAFREAMADETISQILIEIDSPGGSVYGVAELFAEIYSARSSKPVVAIANSLAASAAYWIGCAASEFYVTPGGEVGSIGVWQAHEDWSVAMAEEGIKTTLISAGKYKVEGNPYQPLDEDAQAFMQSRVNDYYGAFTKAVAKGRAVSIDAVRNGMGQGRVLGADAALVEKMVDGIATLDEVIRKMSRSARAGRSSLKAAQASLAILEA